MTTDTYTTTTDWTVPAGVTSFDYECEANGGGGGSTQGITRGGGGGGGGERRVGTGVSVTAGDVVHIVVGALGAGAEAGGSQVGTTGGDVTISINGGSVIVRAKGGVGGNTGGVGLGGAGGTGGTGGTGTDGTAGGTSTATAGSGGGAGGASGSGAAGGAGGGTGNLDGDPGTAPGGGGGGARGSQSTAGGSAGALGRAVISYTATGPGLGTASGTFRWGGLADPMKPLWNALLARESARVNVGALGCSLVEGFPCTPDKTPEQYLASKLRARYPTSGDPAGYGYAPIPTAAMVGITMATVTPGTSSNTGTSNATNGWGANHQVWFSNGSLAVPPILKWTIVNGPWSSFDLPIIGVSGYSTTAGKYRVDGGAWVNFSLASGGAVNEVLHVNTPVTSTVEVTIETGNAASYVIEEGLVGYKGDEAKGIHVHNFGHSGYRVNQWRVSANPSYDFRYAQALLDLDLLVISDLGVNDGQSLTSAQFRTDLLDFITYVKAVHSTIPMLGVGAWDMSAGVSYVEPWDNYARVLADVCNLNGIKFKDLRDSMPATPNAIYHSDNIHGNTNGAAYSLMADVILAEIVPPVKTGTGSGAFAFAGTATGSSPNKGSGSGAYAFAGSAVGTTEKRGTGVGAFAWSGFAGGSTEHRGVGLGVYSYVGQAIGAAPFLPPGEGTAAGGFDWTGDADGSAPMKGAGSGSFHWGGQPAAGETSMKGTGAGGWGFAGTTTVIPLPGGGGSYAPSERMTVVKPEPMLTVVAAEPMVTVVPSED